MIRGLTLTAVRRKKLLRPLLWGCLGIAAVFVVAPSTAAPATATAEAPRAAGWAALTAAQRVALAPLRRDWDRMDALRRQKWLEVAARFEAMTPEERSRVQERMAEWAHLTPAQRAQARLQFQEARQLPAEELQTRWQAYQSLPAAERQRLANRQQSAAARLPAQPAPPAGASAGKTNLVPIGAQPGVRAAGNANAQAKPGATTTPLGSPAAPPHHHQAGLPKIAAVPGFVDTATLLPKRGPQGAAASRAPAGPRQPAAQP